jgi:hypothetical protein
LPQARGARGKTPLDGRAVMRLCLCRYAVMKLKYRVALARDDSE